MTGSVQYGFPNIATVEVNLIARNSFLNCECGLNHFIPCWRRESCLGLKRPVDSSSTGLFSAMQLIKSVFPNARLLQP